MYMLKILLLTIVVVAFCVFALSVSIIFKKNGKFPDGEISHNKALVKQGIQCAKVEEKILWGKKGRYKKKDSCSPEDCSECGADCGAVFGNGSAGR